MTKPSLTWEECTDLLNGLSAITVRMTGELDREKAQALLDLGIFLRIALAEAYQKGIDAR